jgi:hypothetical protein
MSITPGGQSVKLPLAFASRVIPGFSLKIHDQDFYSPPRHVRSLKWGLLVDKAGVGLSM